MKLTQRDVVYVHRDTGVAYSKEHTVLPLAILSETGEKATFGVLLRPYGDHPDVTWDDPQAGADREELLEKYGFIPNEYGQAIVVTDEMFQKHFECLGVLTREVDIEALTRNYEAENCDFSDPEALKKAVLRRVAEAAPGLWACQLYAVLKGFFAKNEKQA